MAEIFTASAQNNDYKGSAAAAWVDTKHFAMLENLVTKKEDEHIVGFSLYLGEVILSGSRPSARPQIKVYLSENPVPEFNSGDDPVSLRRETIDITLEEFFKLFKRFHVLLSMGGCLDGRTVDVDEIEF